MSGVNNMRKCILFKGLPFNGFLLSMKHWTIEAQLTFLGWNNIKEVLNWFNAGKLTENGMKCSS